MPSDGLEYCSRTKTLTVNNYFMYFVSSVLCWCVVKLRNREWKMNSPRFQLHVCGLSGWGLNGFLLQLEPTIKGWLIWRQQRGVSLTFSGTICKSIGLLWRAGIEERYLHYVPQVDKKLKTMCWLCTFLQITKESFDSKAKTLLGESNVHLHNEFLFAILVKCQTGDHPGN